jgi:hypothetical protein
MGLNFRLNAMVGLLFGAAIVARILVLFRRAGLPGEFRPPPRDGSVLFAIRFMLSCTIPGLFVAWLTTRQAYAWPIWGLLTYFGAGGVIAYLVLGVRNARWIWCIRSMSIRGFMAELIHYFLFAVGAVAIVAALARGVRSMWPICGFSLAAVAACSWVVVRCADPEGG